MTWQPWSYTAQFRWIPDEYSDGRITALEWVNNTYENDYGPEYNVLLPLKAKFVVNAMFDRLQVRAKNTVEYTGPTFLPQQTMTNIIADTVDKRFYVRGLDFATEMFTDWYRSPEYTEHPGVPDAPSGSSIEVTGLPFWYVNDSGPVLWDRYSGYVLLLDIPSRAYTVEVTVATYISGGYVGIAPNVTTLNAFPFSAKAPGGFNLNGVIPVAGLAYRRIINVNIDPSQMQWGIRVTTKATNAAGASEVNVFYSTLTYEDGEYSVSSSAIGESEPTQATSGTGTNSGEPSKPPPSGGGGNYVTPTVAPEWIRPEEEDPQIIDWTMLANPEYTFTQLDVSAIAPANAAYAAIPHTFASVRIIPYVYVGGMPKELANARVYDPVGVIETSPIENGMVTIKGRNVSQTLNSWGIGRASNRNFFLGPQPANPVSGEYNVNYAYFRKVGLDKASHTAFRLWWFDVDGKAIGERSEHGQETNRQVTVAEASIYGADGLALDGSTNPPTAEDVTALEQNAMLIADSGWDTLAQWPCRPDTIDEVLDPPPCNNYNPMCSGWMNESQDPITPTPFNAFDFKVLLNGDSGWIAIYQNYKPASSILVSQGLYLEFDFEENVMDLILMLEHRELSRYRTMAYEGVIPSLANNTPHRFRFNGDWTNPLFYINEVEFPLTVDVVYNYVFIYNPTASVQKNWINYSVRLNDEGDPSKKLAIFDCNFIANDMLFKPIPQPPWGLWEVVSDDNPYYEIMMDPPKYWLDP